MAEAQHFDVLSNEVWLDFYEGQAASGVGYQGWTGETEALDDGLWYSERDLARNYSLLLGQNLQKLVKVNSFKFVRTLHYIITLLP